MAKSLENILNDEEEKILACIHCGLCLEACPTYTLTNNENDSPRGRIYLMRAVNEGRLVPSSEVFSRHINRCLGCRACEAACPAGVEYGHLLEAARTEIKQADKKKTSSEKLLHFVLKNIWLNPSRLKLAFALSRRMRDLKLPKVLLKTKLSRLFSKRFELALALLDSSSPNIKGKDRHSAFSATHSCEFDDVQFFKGCVMEGLFAHVNQATVRVLKANECNVEVPEAQVCCGALHAHAGDMEGAKELARKNIEAFLETTGPIITNAGGCGAMLLSYKELFVGDKELSAKAQNFSKRIRDVGQQLKKIGIKQGAKIDERVVTYDASCHLLYGQRASEASLEMLGAIPDLNFVALSGSERCCGGAGVYNLMQPEMSSGVLKEKLDHIKETGAEILATGNPGCQMQIAVGASLNGISLLVCHPVELLDQSYKRAGFYAESMQQPNNLD